VLLIDDEELIGVALKRLLRKQHDATAVTSARAGLGLLADHSYDLIVCDLLMPGLSGIDLFASLQEIHPQAAQRMIFLTGGGFHPDSSTALWLASIPNLIVQKPYESRWLANTIDEMIQAFSESPSR